MRKLRICLITILMIMIISTASALPEILDIFNARYNTRGTVLDTCDTCHISGKLQKPACDEICHIPNKPQKESGSLNPYGVAIKDNLNLSSDQAFVSIENLDSDGDGYNNIDEINNLTFPGNKNDKPKKNTNLLVYLGNGLLGLFNNFHI